MRKKFIVFGVLAVIGGFVVFVSYVPHVPTQKHETQISATPVLEKKNILEQSNTSSSVKMLFVGDLMLDRGVKYYIEQKGNGDYHFPFEKIHNYLSSFDAVIPNLEGPVSDKGTRVGSIYSFRMDPRIFDVFPDERIVAVNVANNHAWDYGREAFQDTLRRMKEKNIGFFGGGTNEQEAYAPYVFEKNNIRVGILGFTEFSEYAQATPENAGIAFANLEKIKNAIKNAKKQKFDALIVVFHFGEEYLPKPIERQIVLAHLAVDEGADIVIGHHPHVVESSEVYHGKQIFYSLGNFIFDQYFSKETMTPGLLEIVVSKEGIRAATLSKGSLNDFFQVSQNVSSGI